MVIPIVNLLRVNIVKIDYTNISEIIFFSVTIYWYIGTPLLVSHLQLKLVLSAYSWLFL